MPSINMKVSALWKPIKSINVKVSTTWQTIQSGWVSVSGIWKQFYTNANAPVKSVSPSLSGTTQVLSSVSAVAGTYTNYSYIVSTRVVHATSSGDLVEGGSYSVETSPYSIPQSIRGTYIAARDVVYGLDGSLYYYFSTPVQITVGTVADTFNRTNAANLGTSSGGLVWSTQQAAWAITSNQASSSNSITNSSPYTDYPISTIDVRRADSTSSANVTGGTALAFWYTAAGSWWAAGPYYTQATAIISNPSGCIGGPINTTNSGDCCDVISSTYHAQECDLSGTVTDTSPCTCGASLISTVTTYSYSTRSTYVPSSTTYYYGSCRSTSLTPVCSGSGSNPTYAQYNCTTGNWQCRTSTTTAAYYLCDGSVSGSTSCPDYGSNGGDRCGSCTPSTTSYYTCSVITVPAYTSYNCHTTVAPSSTTHYYGYSNIKILSTVSNVISTVATQQLASKDNTSCYDYPNCYTYININSISVNTSGNTITVKGYSGSKSLPTDSLTGPIGSDLVYLATSPTKVSGSGSSEVGLTKVTTDYNYGTTIDNFYNIA
jgi:hypothetical protein